MNVIVDYGMGNLQSVAKAVEYLKAPVRISANATDIEQADRLIMPGVGSFGDAAREIGERHLLDALRKFLDKSRPFLGICLGLQLLLDSSEESAEASGLGIFPGHNHRFAGDHFLGHGALKIPQIGWNSVRIKQKECPLFRGIPDDSFFYFVHSYHAVPDEETVMAGQSEYGGSFVSVLWRDHVLATQFHPEKSQKVGLQMLNNFLDM